MIKETIEIVENKPDYNFMYNFFDTQQFVNDIKNLDESNIEKLNVIIRNLPDKFTIDEFWKLAINFKQYIKNHPVKYLIKFYSLLWYVDKNGDRYYYGCKIAKIK